MRQNKFIYDEVEKNEPITTVFLLLFVILGIFYICSLAIDAITEEQQAMYQTHYTMNEQQFIRFFQKHGSPVPEQMAVAVCKTKRPALMAAITVKESNGNPKAIGDAGEAKGAFQVWDKHWGKVPSTASEQALQAERILDELVDGTPRGSLRCTLAKYNGGTRPPRAAYKYADKVMKLAHHIKREMRTGY